MLEVTRLTKMVILYFQNLQRMILALKNQKLVLLVIADFKLAKTVWLILAKIVWLLLAKIVWLLL